MKIHKINNTNINYFAKTNINKQDSICFKTSTTTDSDDEYVKIPKKKYQRDKAIEWGIIIVLLIIEAIRTFSGGKPPKL